jgi:hypothetical protein
MAYHSFGGEVEASNTPTIRRLSPAPSPTSAHSSELAKELHYDGDDTSDSATMNVWLHKQIMRKLAENGGKLPDDLKT